MRRFLLMMIGLSLLLAQLAGPALVGAAPTLTVSPASGPRGTAIGVSAAGLPADTDHLFQFVRGVGNTNTTRLFEDTVRSDARGAIHYRYAVNQDQPGTYTVRIVTLGGTVLATAPFTLTAGQGIPTIGLTPDQGPCSTEPAVAGSGFPPGAAVTFYQQRLDEGGKPVGVARLVTTVRAGPTGGIAPFTVSTLAQDCRDIPPATPEGSRFRFTAVPTGSSPDAAAEPERTAIFTVARDGADSRYFPATGYGIRGRFYAHWRSHGLDLGQEGITEYESLGLFGYPLSGEFSQTLEDGKTYTVQYFERARFEYHPENPAPYDVLLGQFGRRIAAGVPGAPTAPVAPAAGATHFPATGHNVAPPVAAYWARNGGLAAFGYPVSEPFTQTLEDGRAYTVQYFERARFELHPESPDPRQQVLLGQFGRRILGESGGAPISR